MGVLDDAIREHLDLKRRRGADPGEIERAEREALGPVRRGPEPIAADDAETAGVPHDDGSEEPDGLPYDAHADEAWDEEYDEDDDRFAGEPVGEETLVHPAPEPAETPAPPAEPAPSPAARTPEPDDLLMDDELFADPPARRSEAAGDETVEYHVEEALAKEGHAEGEDPLEETPEFLQDTPDHDRLWFEQRPPRDFDFDK